MKSIIKKIVYSFLNENQVHSIKMLAMKSVSLKSNIITNYDVETFGMKDSNAFFGYYDISPFSHCGEKILYLQINKSNMADILVRNLKTNDEIIAGCTKSWNWQQGCRVRWLPGNDNTIIYNDFNNLKYFTKIVDLNNNFTRCLDWPLYDINNTGRFGVTVDFSRLGYYRPGYGYTNIGYIEPSSILNEAISIVDIHLNTIEKIITYEDIWKSLGGSGINLRDCYINHISYCPSGNKFLFFWVQIINGVHHASLLVYDITQKRILVLEDDLSVSHYDWIDDESIVITAYDNHRKCGYYIYSLDNTKKALLPEVLNEDGHPTWIDENILVSDTYTDKYGYQKIICIDINQNKIETIIEIYSSYKISGEKRCDLHPRVNKSNNTICFDSNTNGIRKINILKWWR